MIGESSHSTASTISPQYEEIIQELSDLCTSSLIPSGSFSDLNGNRSSSFFRGELGNHAFVRYSTWKMKRKAQPDNEEEEDDESLLHLAKSVVQECLETCGESSDDDSTNNSLSVWTNPSFGSHILLTAIYHQLEQGEASYQELDHLEDFLEGCIEKLSNEDAEVTCNVMNGLAGTLQGIFFIRRELQRPDWAKKEAIQIAIEILERGQANSEARRFASSAPLYWGKIRGETDWSMSTGCAGILQSLLGLEMNEWNEIETTIPNALDSLLEQTIKQLPAYGRMEYYSRSKKKSGWAMDGAAGHAILLLQCYVVLGSMDYLRQAQRLVRSKILPGCAAYMTDASSLPSDTILGLFDGLVGVCYCLWLSKERDMAKKLINKAIAYCRYQMNTGSRIDLSLANGVSGLVRLLQQIDNRGRDEVEIPFLSSALFNFDMEIQMPLQESGHESSTSLHDRRRKRNELKLMARRQASLPTHSHTDSSGHMRRSYQLTSLSMSKRWTSTSDLDEDSHLSVSSFDNQYHHHPRKHSSLPSQRVRAKRRASNQHSISSTSFSLKEEDENAQKPRHHNNGSPEPTTQDSDDESSSFSTSSHMENATVDDQANAHYLAKQDSDNEEYIYANVSLSLLPGRNFNSGSDSDSTLEQSERKRPPIDRLSLFARTRNQNLSGVDSDDSDSINDNMVAPPPPLNMNEETPSTSNRKSLNSSTSSKDTQPNRRSMIRSPKPQMHQWMTASKRNLMAGMEDENHIPKSFGERRGDKRDNSIPPSSKSSSDDGNESFSESFNEDYDELAIGKPDDLPSQHFLDANDISTRTSTLSAFAGHKPNSTQKKTLMDEECHGFGSVAVDHFPSERFLKEASLQEAENESGSDSMDDEGTIEDDLAIGSPDDMPSAAYLAMHDVSTRTRTYDPMRNYNPVAVQKKTLMDEEGHVRETEGEKIEGNSLRSLSEEVNEDGSSDEDDRADGGDGLAIGSPDELPSSAYLDSLDVSTRERSYDPYANYKPVAAQKKTLMDEEGHGSFTRDTLPHGSNASSSRAIRQSDHSKLSNHSMISVETDDDDEMAIGLPNDLPNMGYLEAHDVSTRTRSYNPYANYKPAKAQQKTLMDEEGHGQHVTADSDDDERSIESMNGGMDMNEKPNAAYLARQNSAEGVYYEYRSSTTTMPSHDLLDEEDHLLVQSDAPAISLDSFIAEEAGQEDQPNPKYLARQDSKQIDYYEYSSKTTKMPSHQMDGSDSKQDKLSSIEAEIEAALKNER